MTESEMIGRTKQFALRVLRLIDALPNTRAGRIVADQLGRSATSVGANYRAACRGRSRAEFAARLGIVEEEADESMFWLELIIEGGLMRAARVEPLWAEADELTAIVVASRRTAARSAPRLGRTTARESRRRASDRKSQIKNRKS